MPSEWHGPADSVMPVWRDVHRTRRATFTADKAPADRRPRQVRGQGVQPDIDHVAASKQGVALPQPERRGERRHDAQRDAKVHFGRLHAERSAIASAGTADESAGCGSEIAWLMRQPKRREVHQ